MDLPSLIHLQQQTKMVLNRNKRAKKWNLQQNKGINKIQEYKIRKNYRRLTN